MLEIGSRILLAIIALEHFGFLILEMFLWPTPLGRGIFRTEEVFAQASWKLAMNQGLYNGFLAAGLVWAAVSLRSDVAVFFLSCVIVAGIFGAFTVSPRIFFLQALPAAVALVLQLLAAR